MKLLAILLIIGFLAVCISLTARLLLKLMNRKQPKPPPSNNPYIDYHKAKIQNDKNYDEYMEWLAKEGEGVPVNKVVSPEDAVADKKIKKLF